MVKGLLVIVVCAVSSACDAPLSLDQSAVPPTTAANGDSEPPQDPKANKPRMYQAILPADLDRSELKGLEVTVRAKSPRAKEAYKIAMFALKADQKDHTHSKRITLGGQDVFKPLAESEKLIVYLEPPVTSAWITNNTGTFLNIDYEIQPGHPDRQTPQVELEIVDVKFVEKD